MEMTPLLSAPETDVGDEARASQPPGLLEARWVRLGLVGIIGAVVAYLLVRALLEPLQYYDAFAYLMNADWLAGRRALDWDGLRPPLLSFLLLPIMALARLGEPANAWLVRGPALLSVTITALSLWVIYHFLRRSLGVTWALVGVALFALSRTVVRYGALVMTDLPVMGLMVATFHVYVSAFERQRLRLFLVAGALAALSVLMKFTAGILAPALVLLHVLLSIDARTFEGKRWLRMAVKLRTLAGLFITGAAAAALTALVMGGVFKLVYRDQAWATFDAKILKFAPTGADPMPGESWTDYLEMMWVVLTPPVCVLAALGFGWVLVRPRRRDVPFIAWMLVIGFGLMIKLAHTEIRYAFPVIPGVIYFAVRGIELLFARVGPLLARRLRPRAIGFAGLGLIAALVVVAGINGVRQAVADADPVFRLDLQRRAAEALVRSVRPNQKMWVMGKWHTLSPKHPGPLPKDEVFNTFHYAPHIPAFFIGKRIDVWLPSRPLPEVREELPYKLNDGDAVLRLDDYFYLGGNFPPETPRPLEVWTVFRRDLKPVNNSGALATEDRSGALKGRIEGDAFVSESDVDEAWVYVSTNTLAYRHLGNMKVQAGKPVKLGLRPDEHVTRIMFIRVTIRKLP